MFEQRPHRICVLYHVLWFNEVHFHSTNMLQTVFITEQPPDNLLSEEILPASANKEGSHNMISAHFNFFKNSCYYGFNCYHELYVLSFESYYLTLLCDCLNPSNHTKCSCYCTQVYVSLVTQGSIILLKNHLRFIQPSKANIQFLSREVYIFQHDEHRL